MQERLKRNLYDNRYALLSFFICMVLVVIAYITMGIYPFGENTVLRIDMFHQYGPFYEELRNKILTGGSMFYSWDGGLGKDFLAQIAYYTASPLGILALLFPQGNIPEMMSFFIMVKIGFCGAFFAYFLRKRFDENGLNILAFSLFYGLSAFVTAFYWNIMWLDAVALFPLVVLGMEKLVEDGKYQLYCLSLAILILSNFYIGFLVCLFSALYFLVLLFSRYSVREQYKLILKKMVKFAVFSLLAGGLAMFLVLPTFYTLQGTAAFDSSFPSAWKVYFHFADYIPAHFMGVSPKVLVRNESLPNVYCGILTMLLLPFYYACKEISLKEKILVTLLLVFMMAGFYLNKLDYMLHGFHFPANLPHRFSFIYSFILIVSAFKAFLRLEAVHIKWIALTAFLFLAYLCANEFIIPKGDSTVRVLSDTALILNAVFIVLYVLVLFLWQNNGWPMSRVSIFLAALVVVEMGISTSLGLNHTGSTNRENYVKYLKDSNEIRSYLEEADQGFYRTEFRRFLTINDGALYHIRNMSQFSSTANGDTSELIKALGISSTSNSYRYYDPTPLLNSIFNIKYIINKDERIPNTTLPFVFQSESLYLHENPYALPVGFWVDEDILDWDTGQNSPFNVQNDFARQAARQSGNMFTHLAILDSTTEYTEITSNNEEGVYRYQLEDETNLDNVPGMSFTLYNPKDQYVFLYVDSPNSQRVVITAGEKSSDRDFGTGRSLFDLGYVEAGQEILVEFKLNRKGADEKTYRKSATVRVFGAGYNTDVFENTYRALSRNTLQVVNFGDTFIEGFIEADEKGVLFTSIPYHKGFRVYIDGTETEILDIANYALLAAPLESGYHEVLIEFHPVGFVEGLSVSAVSLLLFLGYMFWDRKRFIKSS